MKAGWSEGRVKRSLRERGKGGSREVDGEGGRRMAI